ncbi:unnamed protein product [Sphagnum balticum]
MNNLDAIGSALKSSEPVFTVRVDSSGDIRFDLKEKYSPPASNDPVVELVSRTWSESLNLAKRRIEPSFNADGAFSDIMRTHLRAEVCVALHNYNPDYRTKEGRSVKESTFVYQHLFNRIGQMMKRLTKKRYGYGVWHSNLEETLWETDRE